MIRIRENRVFIGKILIVSLICAVTTIPLHNNLNSWALVFFCTMGLIRAVEDPVNLKVSWLALVSALFFIWLALTAFWDDYGFDMKYVERYAGFLFLPFIFSIIPNLSARAVRIICIAFALAATAITVICLIKSALEYRHTGDYRVFYYHYLAQQMKLNAVFLAGYCLQSMVWLLYFWFVHPQRPGKPGPWVIIVWCLYLIFAVLLLSSKLIIFLMVITLTFLLLYIGYKRKQFVKSIVALLVVMAITGIAVTNFHYIRWRFTATELREYRGDIDNQNGLAIRLLMWRSALELIKERPLAGYGLKGGNKALLQKYKEKNFQLGFEQEYHSHNQYLQTTLEAGIVGFALLATFVVMIAVRAFRTRSMLLGIILLHFLAYSFSDCPLAVQQQLIFFIFFMLFFYYHHIPPGVENKDQSFSMTQQSL